MVFVGWEPKLLEQYDMVFEVESIRSRINISCVLYLKPFLQSSFGRCVASKAILNPRQLALAQMVLPYLVREVECEVVSSRPTSIGCLMVLYLLFEVIVLDSMPAFVIASLCYDY